MILHGYAGSCRFFDVIGDTVYEGESYSEGDEFKYQGHEITMEEYEELVNSIDWLED